jgi:hypothetical protein
VITALVFRLHVTTDHRGLHEVLEHNRADLQRYKDELASLQNAGVDREVSRSLLRLMARRQNQ